MRGVRRTLMTITKERLDSIVVLRYAGTHEFQPEQWRQDEEVEQFLGDQCETGERCFLIDVRELRLTYGSSLATLWNRAWRPILCEDSRVAILWRRHPESKRIGYLAESVGRADASSPMFFEDEEAAVRYLRTGNTDAG